MLRDLERLDVELLPPGGLVAGLMQLAVMTSAEGHGELIAYLEANGSRLRKAQVMRVARLAATDKAGLDACISNRGEGERKERTVRSAVG